MGVRERIFFLYAFGLHTPKIVHYVGEVFVMKSLTQSTPNSGGEYRAGAGALLRIKYCVFTNKAPTVKIREETTAPM